MFICLSGIRQGAAWEMKEGKSESKGVSQVRGSCLREMLTPTDFDVSFPNLSPL